MNTIHQNLESLKLMECPLNIAFEGHIINGKFTFEELTRVYWSINKEIITQTITKCFTGVSVKPIYGYILRGMMENNTFALESYHHYPDEPHKLIIIRIPGGKPLEDFISPSSIWTRNNGKFLFQIIPSVIRWEIYL